MLSAIKTVGKWGSILLLITLLIALIRQLIAFIGFITTVIKVLVVLAFVALFLLVGYLVFRTIVENQRRKQEEE